ncbi:hypothetical protein AQF52_7801 [Streptomyces venezuelae]|nr:hypothetical protein AQF52_7801 [Streptomyces venezuelae]CUM35901.1 hypothetical protein BN2537_767 [Streptomyces venezuelae]
MAWTTHGGDLAALQEDVDVDVAVFRGAVRDHLRVGHRVRAGGAHGDRPGPFGLVRYRVQAADLVPGLRQDIGFARQLLGDQHGTLPAQGEPRRGQRSAKVRRIVPVHLPLHRLVTIRDGFLLAANQAGHALDTRLGAGSPLSSQSTHQRVKVTGFPVRSRSGARSASSARRSDQMVPRWVPVMISLPLTSPGWRSTPLHPRP